MPVWLKSLRLHKYQELFAQMSFDDMMTLTEEELEEKVKVEKEINVVSHLFVRVECHKGSSAQDRRKYTEAEGKRKSTGRYGRGTCRISSIPAHITFSLLRTSENRADCRRSSKT